jgi:hypothetical protein
MIDRQTAAIRDRQTASIVALFVLAGAVLEIASIWIGLAFMGAKGFTSHWGFATLYFLGQWPNWVLPTLPSQWENLYLIAPAIGWGLIGLLVAKLISRRDSRLNHNVISAALRK